MTEKTLIAKAKRGNRKAQTDLYTKYKSYWFMLCMRYHSNREDALDSLQEGLLNVFMKIDQFDESKGAFKSWSAKVMINKCLAELKKQKYLELNEAMVPEMNSDFSVYEDDVLSQESLMRMIQELPHGYRIIFNLYVLEGYTHKEIAKYLDISEGTSKSQLFKAKRMLRKTLDARYVVKM